MSISTLLNAMPGAVAQGLIWGIMAIGVYITYKILDVADLSVDGTMCTGGAVCIVMLMNGAPMWLALLVSFIVGMVAGLATGILHTFMGIPAILAGILTQLGLYSINLKILGKANVPVNNQKYNLIVSLKYLKDVPFYKNTILVVAIFLIVLIAALYWFFGTALGHSLRATGCNPNMSRAQGINTNFNIVLGLMLSNGIVAISSALLAQYNGFVDINMGKGAIVIGLAAVIIGEVLFGKIFGNFALKLAAVAIGGVVYYGVLQVVIWLGFDTNLLKLLSACVVALFLAIPYLKKKYFTKVKNTPKTYEKSTVNASAKVKEPSVDKETKTECPTEEDDSHEVLPETESVADDKAGNAVNKSKNKNKNTGKVRSNTKRKRSRNKNKKRSKNR